MKGSAIRHIAGSHSGSRIAVAEFKKMVSIWDLKTFQKQSEFETVLDFGGNRLGVDNDCEKCVAGAYYLHGIACYNAKNGSLLWQRKDLKKVQNICVTPDGGHAACGFENGPLCLLDMRDGKTAEALRGCRSLMVSPYEPVRIADKTIPEIQTLEGVGIAKLKREAFAILSIAFGRGFLVVSESGGPVRCFETSTGKMVWRHQPSPGAHVLTLGYNQQSDFFMGILWPFEKGGQKTLLIFDSNSGDAQISFPLRNSVAEEFCSYGKYLLSSEGWLLESSTGRLCGDFDFPKKDCEQS